MSKSAVEEFFLARSSVPFLDRAIERIPVITAGNYVVLGQLAALRFLEWALTNPEGVVSLPTGKTPEYFIKWVHYYLRNWDRESGEGLPARVGLTAKPSLRGLHFVQIDEFFPMEPAHERSFNYYVKKYYLEGFGLDPSRALTIDTFTVDPALRRLAPTIANVEAAFPDGMIDLGLRHLQALTEQQALQQRVIRHFDQFCEEYEAKIAALGGIGFFLGGLGPDGHVGFNTRGSSHYSATRLAHMNYETMAVAAQDLGGIESARKKAIITIGLGTITRNPDSVAIVFAAGETKSSIVAAALEHAPHIDYPATSLQKLPGARFYLTVGAASLLRERRFATLRATAGAPESECHRLVIDGALCRGTRLADVGTQQETESASRLWAMARELTQRSPAETAHDASAKIEERIRRGLAIPKNQRFLHTGPHHDDIELAYFPLVHHLVRSPENENHFCYLTSGFTSVTNVFVLETLKALRSALKSGALYRAVPRAEICDRALKHREIHGYLNAIAARNRERQLFCTSVRMARRFFASLSTDSDVQVLDHIDGLVESARRQAPGQLDPPGVQNVKSWIREWEAELVWAHFGLPVECTHHLRLEFYTGDIFPEDPTFQRDVVPVIDLLERVEPTVVTLAMDPEGSGPDTHYKTMLAMRSALRAYAEHHPRNPPRVWGYRNVWSRFHISEADMIVPISLNSLAVLHNMFDTCFRSQRSASFPSFELDGTFSELAHKIWVEQFNDLSTLLGRRHFHDNPHPMMRRAYGAIYLKEMALDEFLEQTKALDELVDDKRVLGAA